MNKVEQAGNRADIEIAGFLWLHGRGDTKRVDVAAEYLENLESLVAAVRERTGVADMPGTSTTTRRDNLEVGELFAERFLD